MTVLLRLSRFVLLAGIACFAIALDAPGIRDAVSGWSAPAALYAVPPPFVGALVFVAGSLVYLAWLGGATLFGWRMAPLAQTPVLLFGAYLAIKGPVLIPGSIDVDAQRAAALGTLAQSAAMLARTPGASCVERVQNGRAALEKLVDQFGPKYRAHGLRRRPAAVLVASAEEIPPQAKPGTLQIECRPDRAQLAFVVLNGLPAGTPVLLADEVGRTVLRTALFE